MPSVTTTTANNGGAPAIDKKIIPQLSSTQPSSPVEWIEKAREVGRILEVDAVERDKANGKPEHEVNLLKQAGLITYLQPAKFGGGGGTWEVAYKLIRTISEYDGSIGQLLGYHLLWSWLAYVLFDNEKYEAFIEPHTRNRSFFGGAVNPRDADLTIRDEGDSIVFNGVKSFSTGGRISDVTVLEGVLDGTDKHIFSFVPTNQPGIQFKGDWDALGQRLTESGGVVIDDVRVPWEGAAGWDPVAKTYTPIPYHTITLPLIQHNFSNKYLGIAIGGLRFAQQYTTSKTRPWPASEGGRGHDNALEEWYILEGYGVLYAGVRASEALHDQVGAAISKLAHAPKESLTPEQRGIIAAEVATAKVSIVDHALHLTSKVYELTGARATSSKVGLDRFWRNVRTHTLHDPIAYKKTEVGAYYLEGRLPKPTWYT
ncbi:hypothetical protein PYCC9005_005907 [Savitreella phatthalungensis]